MKLKIMVDSSSGIQQEEAKQLGIEVFPLKIIFDNKEYLDGIDIHSDSFYQKLVNEKLFPKTSLPNLFSLEERMKYWTKEGYSVLILCLSSKLSGTYNAIAMLATSFANVHVIDSLTTIGGLRFLVEDALAHQDDTMEEIIARLENLKKRVHILAVPETLEYLHRGGRLSKSVQIIANFLDLKPIIEVIDGEVVCSSKKRGKKQAMKYVYSRLKETHLDSNYIVRGLYSHVELNCDELIRNFDPKYQSLVQQKENIAAVIACHVGPNAYGLIYIEQEKK